jgi:hypothetical protein
MIMKSLFPLALACAAFSATALPKVGYYKSLYSLSQGEFTCSRVLSNTKQVTISGKKVTYFEAILGGGTKMTCIPQAFIDTDGTSDDGDPTRLIFASQSTAFCTSVDGNVHVDISFDSSRIFWSGDSYMSLTVPGSSAPVLAKLKERQTSYGEFFSATACP